MVQAVPMTSQHHEMAPPLLCTRCARPVDDVVTSSTRHSRPLPPPHQQTRTCKRRSDTGELHGGVPRGGVRELGLQNTDEAPHIHVRAEDILEAMLPSPVTLQHQPAHECDNNALTSHRTVPPAVLSQAPAITVTQPEVFSSTQDDSVPPQVPLRTYRSNSSSVSASSSESSSSSSCSSGESLSPPGSPTMDPRHKYALLAELDTLRRCDHYHGRMTSQQARATLRGHPVGTYLLRESSDPRYVCSVSVRTARGTTSIRVAYDAGVFFLDYDDATSRKDGVIKAPSVLQLLARYEQMAAKGITDKGSHCVFLESTGRKDTPVLLTTPLRTKDSDSSRLHSR